MGGGNKISWVHICSQGNIFEDKWTVEYNIIAGAP